MRTIHTLLLPGVSTPSACETSRQRVVPVVSTPTKRIPNYFSMIRDFRKRAPTVSEGCAPFESHALIAGAFRLDCFLIGSYHPSSCFGNVKRK